MHLIFFLCVPVNNNVPKIGFLEKFTAWGDLSFFHNFALPWLGKSIS